MTAPDLNRGYSTESVMPKPSHCTFVGVVFSLLLAVFLLLLAIFLWGSKISHTGGKCVSWSGLTNSRWTLNAFQRCPVQYLREENKVTLLAGLISDSFTVWGTNLGVTVKKTFLIGHNFHPD